MADNTVLNPGSGGDTIKTEDIGAYKIPVTKLYLGAADADGGPITLTNPAPVTLVDPSGVNRVSVTAAGAMKVDASATNQPGLGFADTINVSVTRPADTAAYAANDAWSNSTTVPAAITFAGVARASGGSAQLVDLVVISSANPATALQGELWLFDTAPAPINDNAAFTVTDPESLTFVCKIPFTLDSTGNPTVGAGGNILCQVPAPFVAKCVGSANLTGLIKVINAYTPVSGEVLSFRLKIIQIN